MALLLTLVGISLVLFVHELGHFLAARRAGVRVEVFSLGFGPRLAGLRRGDTDYRLSLLPLGGYVLVAGESLGGPPRPGELMAASRRGRLLFYLGGIMMNFAFAILALPLLFGLGVPFESPVVGTVEPGGAAWQAGLRAGDRILAVDGRAVHGFRHVATATALAARGAPLAVRAERAGEAFEVLAAPQWSETLQIQLLGLGQAFEIAPAPDGPAARAGLRAEDEILSLDGIPVADTAAAQAILQALSAAPEPVTVRYRRDGAEAELLLTPEPAPPGPPQLGVLERVDRVVAARGPLDGHLLPGDLLLRADGQEITGPGELLHAALRVGHLPALELLRNGALVRLPARPEVAPEQLAPALHLASGPGLRFAVRPGSAADRAGLRGTDALLRVDTEAVSDFAGLREAVAGRVAAAGDGPPPELALTVLPAGAERTAVLRVRPEPIVQYDLGLGLRTRIETVRSANPARALALGLREVGSTTAEVLLTLRRMVSGELPASNLGGIISIGQVTHGFAAQGLAPLLLFLCVISINLAILNLLPVPGLDGGHVLLLLIETLRRKPVGVRARNAFNLLGFGVVIALLLFVTMLDLRRLFG